MEAVIWRFLEPDAKKGAVLIAPTPAAARRSTLNTIEEIYTRRVALVEQMPQDWRGIWELAAHCMRAARWARVNSMHAHARKFAKDAAARTLQFLARCSHDQLAPEQQPAVDAETHVLPAFLNLAEAFSISRRYAPPRLPKTKSH